jgi:hypothetical protein
VSVIVAAKDLLGLVDPVQCLVSIMDSMRH